MKVIAGGMVRQPSIPCSFEKIREKGIFNDNITLAPRGVIERNVRRIILPHLLSTCLIHGAKKGNKIKLSREPFPPWDSEGYIGPYSLCIINVQCLQITKLIRLWLQFVVELRSFCWDFYMGVGRRGWDGWGDEKAEIHFYGWFLFWGKAELGWFA